MMMMFQLYTELPSGNLSPGSEICGCQEGGQLKCTMLEEVIIINVLTKNLFLEWFNAVTINQTGEGSKN